MKKQIRHLAKSLLIFLFVSMSYSNELSDEEVWEFVVFLYGTDQEQKKELSLVSLVERETLMAETRKLYENFSEDEKQEFPIKSSKDFTKEERKRWSLVRTLFKSNKKEIQTAKEKVNALDESDIVRIASLSLKLLIQHAGEDYQYNKYSKNLNQIPEEWSFLDPQALYVGSNYVDVWLYRNALNNDGPQIHLNVRKNNDDTILVQHIEGLEEVIQEWNNVNFSKKGCQKAFKRDRLIIVDESHTLPEGSFSPYLDPNIVGPRLRPYYRYPAPSGGGYSAIFGGRSGEIMASIFK